MLIVRRTPMVVAGLGLEGHGWYAAANDDLTGSSGNPRSRLTTMAFPLSFPCRWSGMAMEVVHESPDVADNSYEWTSKMLGLLRKGVTAGTAYVPGEPIGFRNFGAMERTRAATVEPDIGGSKVIHRMDTSPSVPVIGRLLDPMLRRGWVELAWGTREMEKQRRPRIQRPLRCADWTCGALTVVPSAE